MKKRILNLLIAATLSVITLSSCLGDMESSISGSGEYALIAEDSSTGSKYVIAPSASSYRCVFNFPGIEAFRQGDVIKLASYKVNLDKTPASYIYTAENVILDNEVYLVANQNPVKFENATAETDTINLFTDNIKLISTLGDGTFGDRWIISYKCRLKDGERAKINVMLDTNNQDESDKSTYTLDIRLEKTSIPSDDETVKDEFHTAVLDLTNLRRYLEGKLGDIDENPNYPGYKAFKIKLRTYLLTTTNTPHPSTNVSASLFFYINEK